MPLFIPPDGWGNVLFVDTIKGDDLKATRGGFPFKTLPVALAAAQVGDVIYLRPGNYDLTSGITIPASVAIVGINSNQSSIRMLGVTANTTLITMGEDSRLEDVNLTLTSASHFNLTGVAFPGTTSETAKVRRVVILVDNKSASDGGTSDVIGVHSNGTGQPAREILAMRACTVTVLSAGLGTKRGFFSNTANKFNARDTTFACRRTGTGAGSYIAVSVNHASTVVTCAACLADGTPTADISKTLGTLIFSDTLVNGTTNNTPIESNVVLPFMIWADSGGMPSGATRYLRPGTGSVNATPVQVRLPQAGTANSISIQSAAGPGGVKVDTFTIQKNGIDTELIVTLTGTQTENSATFDVPFIVGDKISVKVVTATASATTDIVLVVNFVK